MIEVCNCENCGNEAEMSITCKLVEIKEPSGVKKHKEHKSRTCTVCGSKADMIINVNK
jgi:transcription elongation factor Elf1